MNDLFSSSGETAVGFRRSDAERPLVVDLDETLVQTDLLIESLFAFLSANPLRVASTPGLLSSMGRARLKAEIARETPIDVARLPYNSHVLSLISEARASGRRVYLASASNERYVEAVANHLGVFDGWFASSADENLKSSTKAARLTEIFGERGFDYVGNEGADLAVWSVAKHCIAVSPSPAVKAALMRIDANASILNLSAGGLRAWLKLLRIHQWAKNALVFVPAFAAHRFDASSVVQAFIAAASFSLAASSIYILNDLVDLDADRGHRSKRLRPLASGTVSIRKALVACPLLLLLAFALGLLLPSSFLAVLAAYLALTTAYTFYLKSMTMVDIVTLASLYTLRVLAGAAAVAAVPSEWILAFSMFIFTSLALMKRYVELTARLDAALPDPTNRDYRKSDLATLAALAAASGFNAVTVFALYIYSEKVHTLYRHPEALWLICPILLYWVGRALILADRRLMDDDPIMFALKDRVSLLSFALIAAIMVAAA